MSSRVDWRDDRGMFAGVEALPFSILVFVIGSLLAANAWAVIDAKLATTSAARQAVRVVVESPPAAAEQLAALGDDAADRALDAHGRTPQPGNTTVDLPDGFQRCAPVSATVTHTVPAITLPFIGGYGSGFTVTSTHSEIIDPYRDGDFGGSCG